MLENSIPYWDKLTPKEQQIIKDNTISRTFDKNMIISRTDSECKGMIIIKTGQIRVYITSEDGREVTLYRLTSGDSCVLSASCLLDSIAFDVMIEAAETTEIYLIPSMILQHLNEENPWVEAFMYRTAAERFSDVMWTMQQIMFFGADKRVAVFLWDEMIRTHNTVLHYTHEDVAKLIGSAREVVSKMLKYFAQEGAVALKRGRIEIIDKDKLRKYL